jgi:hypothetical protein
MPYVRDAPYRSNFVPSQAPLLLSGVAAQAGYVPPDPRGPFRYLELGCGSGATLNALAAACPQGEFIGVDFNGASIAAAREFAAAAGLGNVSYVEAAFSAIAPGDIAPVDFMASAGTYSWLDSAEKQALLGIVADTLMPGGLLYLGYVTLGRAAVTPMWQLLRALAPATGEDSVRRLTGAVELLAALRDSGAAYPQQNPQALAVLNDVQAQCRSGDAAAVDNLAHNILAEGFRIELLDQVCAGLAPAGLDFCGSAAPYLNDPDLAVPVALRARFDALPTPVARALFQDFMGATLARTDIFVRAGRLDAEAAGHYLRTGLGAGLVGPAAETWRQLEKPGWTRFDFNTPVLRHVFGRIEAGVTTVAEIAADAPFPEAAVRDAFYKLAASPGVSLCLPTARGIPAILPPAVSPSSGFNRLALEAARAGVATVQLAAPGLGSCLPLTLPLSLLVAELCATGTAISTAELHARLISHVARIPGVEPAAASQFANPAFFSQLHQAVIGGVLPMLLRYGALVAHS